MSDVYHIITTVMSNGFNICFVVLFYLSLKKCFLKTKKGKIKLLLLSLVTNPILLIVIPTFITYTTYLIATLFSSGYDFKSGTDLTEFSPSETAVTFVVGGIISIIMTLLFSHLVARWLKAPNPSLVTFVYLMFVVIYGLSSGVTLAKNDNNELLSFGIDLLNSIALLIAAVLLYRFDIKALSGLTDKKHSINWKIFVIPPVILLPFYYAISYSTYLYMTLEANFVVYLLSLAILYLFIWAFYVIIKNINATNEAIDARDEVKTLSVEVMEALAHTIDAKDKYTNGHSVRVANYSRMIAKKMGLDETLCENIYYMGLLHDIGKIGVPNEIINKPSRLSDEEYDIIKTHPGIGYSILSEMKSRPDLARGALWHHERYDGKGYPEHKAGEDIPIEARIIAVADTYDAMTSNRSYRNYLPQDIVRAELEKNSGTQFDPEAAKCMIAIMDEDKDYILHE